MGKQKQLLQGSKEFATLDTPLVEMIFTLLDKHTLLSFSQASKYWCTKIQTYLTSKTHGLFKHPDDINDILIKAVIHGHPLIVKKYLAQGANPNISIRNDSIYLMYKISNCCKPKIKKCGILLNPSALHLAALYSNNSHAVDIIKLLLKAGSKINAMVRGCFSTLDIRMLNHIFDKPQPDLRGQNDVIITHKGLKRSKWIECEVELSPISLARNKTVKSLLYIALFEQFACNNTDLKSAIDALSQAKASDAYETKKYVLELMQCQGDFQGLSCVLSENTINTLKEQLDVTMSFNNAKCTIL